MMRSCPPPQHFDDRRNSVGYAPIPLLDRRYSPELHVAMSSLVWLRNQPSIQPVANGFFPATKGTAKDCGCDHRRVVMNYRCDHSKNLRLWRDLAGILIYDDRNRALCAGLFFGSWFNLFGSPRCRFNQSLPPLAGFFMSAILQILITKLVLFL